MESTYTQKRLTLTKSFSIFFSWSTKGLWSYTEKKSGSEVVQLFAITSSRRSASHLRALIVGRLVITLAQYNPKAESVPAPEPKARQEEAWYSPLVGTTERNPNGCGCRACNPNAGWFIVCPDCGNKRCPKATNHEYTCTRSNDPGQDGSIFLGDLSPEACDRARRTDLLQWLDSSTGATIGEEISATADRQYWLIVDPFGAGIELWAKGAYIDTLASLAAAKFRAQELHDAAQ